MQPEIIIIPTLLGTIGFIVWTAISSWQHRHRLKVMTEFNARVIDRLGSLSDFNDFAKTEAGARFLNGSIAELPKLRPADRILRAVQIGIVLILLATGLLSLGAYFQDSSRDAFIVLGVISMSMGSGFLLSSAASHKISRSLGLFRDATVRQD